MNFNVIKGFKETIPKRVTIIEIKHRCFYKYGQHMSFGIWPRNSQGMEVQLPIDHPISRHKKPAKNK